MDYGRNTGTDNTPEFFTAGAGTNQENLNTFEAENNLDLTNTQADWNSTPIERSNKGLGDIAIESAGLSSNLEVANTPNTNQENQTVNLEMPPTANGEKALVVNDAAEQTTTFNEKNIKTGEKLVDSGVQEVDAVISKLDQDGNTADFYEDARKMMEVNLDRSYGENAAWKGGEKAA